MPVAWWLVAAVVVPVLSRLAMCALGVGTIAVLWVLDRRDSAAAAAESDD
jgi:hypothetical protein